MSVRAALFWSYGVNAGVLLVYLAGTITISRLLSAHELGVFGMGFAFSGLFMALSQFGVAHYLVRERDLDRARIASAFTINALVALIGTALVWTAGSFARRLFGDEAVGPVLHLLAFVPLLSIFEFLPSTFLMRAMAFRPLTLVQFGKSCANAVAMIAFALAGWSYLAPAMGALCSALFGAVVFTLVGRAHVGFRLSLRHAREVLVFCVQMLSAGGASIFAPRLAELAIGNLLGLSALGVYTRASVLANLVWEGAYGLSTRVIYVRMAREQRETGSVHETFLGASALLTVVMWPAMGGIALLAPPLIELLYGPAWHAAAVPLALLMLGQLVAIGFAMNWELCVLTHRTAWQARVEVLRGLAGLGFVAVGALVALPLAVAGRLAAEVIGYAIYRPRLAAMAGVGEGAVGKVYRASVVPSLAALAPACLLMLATGWSARTSLWLVVPTVLAGIIAWLAALRARAHPAFAPIAEALGRVGLRV